MQIIHHHVISRQEIEDLDFTRFLRRFEMIDRLPTPKLLLYRDSLLLEISGYGDQEEELYTVPQVRNFFQSLTERWPFWLFALHLDAESSLLPLLCLLPSVTAVKRTGSDKTAAGFDPGQMGNVLLWLFPWMNVLCDRADLGEGYIEERSKKVIALCFGEGGVL